MPLLEIEGLSVAYHRPGRLGEARTHFAVDNATLSLERGQIVGVVGESGSGKSSLAKAVVGMIPATAGTVRLDGVPLGRHRAVSVRRQVQMVFQDPASALNPSMSVGQAIIELLRASGRDSRESKNRAAELIDLVGLSVATLDARPSSLSGGQRQRVSIARAMATDPRVIVADEPTSALDVSVQATVLNLLRELVDSFGLSVLFISHDLGVVRRVCELVAVMHNGRIVEHQPAADLFRSPRDSYTRQLLESIPTLNVTAEGRIDGRRERNSR